MSSLLRCRIAAALCVLASVDAISAEVAPYDPLQSAPFSAMPVHLVALNDELRSQVAYPVEQPAEMHALLQSQIQLQMDAAASSRMNVATAGLAGGLGAGIGMAIVNAAARESAMNQVMPADTMLRSMNCALPMRQAHLAALERALQSAPWGSEVKPRTHLMPAKGSIEKLTGKEERYVVSFAYSLAPDYSSVITVVSADAYSPALPGAPKRWETTPTWSNVLFVVSDQLELERKTPEDVAQAVSDEKTRFNSPRTIELIKRANAGDYDARSSAAKLFREHERLLRDAELEDWTQTQAAVRRARLWSENDCVRLKQAIEGNIQEMESVMARLLHGGLPSPPESVLKPNPLDMLDGEVAGERRLHALERGVHVSRRGGDLVPLGHATSWLPSPKASR